MSAILKVLRAHSGEEFEADEFPTLEDGKRAVVEHAALVEVEEQMRREHDHHHIPGTADCHGCGLLAKLDTVRSES